MKRLSAVFAIAAFFLIAPIAADSNAEVEQQILALERAAMDGWLNGNPAPALAVTAGEVSYFHAVTNGRLVGIEAVRKLYEQYRGKALFDSYDIVDPKVQASGETAVLTYILATRNGGNTTRWNATQVYERTPKGWRIIHSHWSMTNPPQP